MCESQGLQGMLYAPLPLKIPAAGACQVSGAPQLLRELAGRDGACLHAPLHPRTRQAGIAGHTISLPGCGLQLPQPPLQHLEEIIWAFLRNTLMVLSGGCQLALLSKQNICSLHNIWDSQAATWPDSSPAIRSVRCNSPESQGHTGPS